jgi:hypothetical protein
MREAPQKLARVNLAHAYFGSFSRCPSGRDGADLVYSTHKRTPQVDETEARLRGVFLPLEHLWHYAQRSPNRGEQSS